MQETLEIADQRRELSFPVAGVPIPQGSKTAQVVGPVVYVGGRRAVIEPKVIMTDLADMSTKTMGRDRLKRWRENVRIRATVARDRCGFDRFTGPVILEAEFVLPRAGSHFTSRGALRKSAPRFPRLPDVSKLLRAIEDAMTGTIYDDDSQIVRAVVSKRFAAAGGTGGALIKVREQ